MPSHDLLVSLVGHADERAVSAHAPEDGVRLLLVRDLDDLADRYVFR